jgi:hypothetical protein
MNTMNPKQAVPSAQRAVVSKPPLAVMVRPNGSARRRGATEAGKSRDERIRAAAYQLYEARGRLDGHDMDDWLAAEAAVDGRAG